MSDTPMTDAIEVGKTIERRRIVEELRAKAREYRTEAVLLRGGRRSSALHGAAANLEKQAARIELGVPLVSGPPPGTLVRSVATDRAAGMRLVVEHARDPKKPLGQIAFTSNVAIQRIFLNYDGGLSAFERGMWVCSSPTDDISQRRAGSARINNLDRDAGWIEAEQDWYCLIPAIAPGDFLFLEPDEK